jgi:hypothetical protein
VYEAEVVEALTLVISGARYRLSHLPPEPAHVVRETVTFCLRWSHFSRDLVDMQATPLKSVNETPEGVMSRATLSEVKSLLVGDTDAPALRERLACVWAATGLPIGADAQQYLRHLDRLGRPIARNAAGLRGLPGP